MGANRGGFWFSWVLATATTCPSVGAKPLARERLTELESKAGQKRDARREVDARADRREAIDVGFRDP